MSKKEHSLENLENGIFNSKQKQEWNLSVQFERLSKDAKNIASQITALSNPDNLPSWSIKEAEERVNHLTTLLGEVEDRLAKIQEELEYNKTERH